MRSIFSYQTLFTLLFKFLKASHRLRLSFSVSAALTMELILKWKKSLVSFSLFASQLSLRLCVLWVGCGRVTINSFALILPTALLLQQWLCVRFYRVKCQWSVTTAAHSSFAMGKELRRVHEIYPILGFFSHFLLRWLFELNSFLCKSDVTAGLLRFYLWSLDWHQISIDCWTDPTEWH